MSKKKEAFECISLYNSRFFSEKNLLTTFRIFKGTVYCSETENFPYLEQTKKKKEWSYIVHQRAMYEETDVLAEIGLRGLVFSVCEKILTFYDWPIIKEYTPFLIHEMGNSNSFYKKAYDSVCDNEDVKHSCVAYLRLKCICENKSLILSKDLLYIQLNLLCENILFYLFYQIAFSTCKALLESTPLKKYMSQSQSKLELDKTNLDLLKNLKESQCSELVEGKKCDEETEYTEGLWPLKLFKNLNNIIALFVEPLFKEEDLENCLNTVTKSNCLIKEIQQLSHKFKDLWKYDIIKSIKYDPSVKEKEFSRIVPTFDNEMLIKETLKYIDELLSSPNLSLVGEIKSKQGNCPPPAFVASRHSNRLKKSGKKSHKKKSGKKSHKSTAC